MRLLVPVLVFGTMGVLATLTVCWSVDPLRFGGVLPDRGIARSAVKELPVPNDVVEVRIGEMTARFVGDPSAPRSAHEVLAAFTRHIG